MALERLHDSGQVAPFRLIVVIKEDDHFARRLGKSAESCVRQSLPLLLHNARPRIRLQKSSNVPKRCHWRVAVVVDDDALHIPIEPAIKSFYCVKSATEMQRLWIVCADDDRQIDHWLARKKLRHSRS